MIGMDFVSFVILLVMALAVAAVFHFVLSYRVISGWGSYFSKAVLGWIGAWLGPPVLGYWWEPLRYGNVYIIPAILGCAALIVLVVDLFQTAAAKKSS